MRNKPIRAGIRSLVDLSMEIYAPPNPSVPMTPSTPLASSPPPNILVVTTPFVPGFRIIRTLGVTWGLIVRSRGLGRNITAGFRSLAGGEITEYSQLLDQTRHEALQRLQQHALTLGANAVIGVGFDSSELGDVMTEILAYGTAVQVEPDPTAPQPVTLR
jgi:uncharacterized protein YbjQ (UPF0145 family)